MHKSQFKQGDMVKVTDIRGIMRGEEWKEGEIVEVLGFDHDGWVKLHTPNHTSPLREMHGSNGKPSMLIAPHEEDHLVLVKRGKTATNRIFDERLAQLKKELAATNDALEVDILLARIDELGRIQKLIEEE